jgi:fibronectin type 3 domain-containing protein
MHNAKTKLNIESATTKTSQRLRNVNSMLKTRLSYKILKAFTIIYCIVFVFITRAFSQNNAGIVIINNNGPLSVYNYDLGSDNWYGPLSQYTPGSPDRIEIAYDIESNVLICLTSHNNHISVDYYDLNNNSWGSKTGLDNNIGNYAVAYDIESDRIVLIYYWNTTLNTYAYDFNSDTWEQKTTIDIGTEAYLEITYDIESDRMVVAKWVGSDPNNVSTYIYDLNNDLWSVGSNLTTGTISSMDLTYDYESDRVVLIEYNDDYITAHGYEVNTNSWTTYSTNNVVGIQEVSATYDIDYDRIVVITHSSTTDEVKTYSYDLNSDLWSVKSSTSINNIWIDIESTRNILVPPTPQNLTAQPGNGKVTLSWDPVSDLDLAKYRIYRGQTSWNITLLDSVVASSPPDTFYVDNSVHNDSTYYYYITAVDSAGNVSGNSDTVSVTPTGSIVAELLVGAAQTSTGGQDQGYSLNTWYHDVKHQSIYHAQDLANAGLEPGATITAVELWPSQPPGQDLQNFRVATAWTTVASLSDSFVTTTVGYGPAYHYTWEFSINTWKRFPITPIIWNGTDNLVVEFSHDNNSYTEGGGIYVREAGPGRGRRGWTDSGAGSYPFSGMTEADDSKVTALRVVYTLPDVLPPPNLTATPGYQQVTLTWSPSPSSDLAGYIVYRGLTSATLVAVDSVGASDTSYTATGLTNGVTYWYAVKAKNTSNEYSSLSAPVSAVPRVAPPTNLSAIAGSRQVTLNWTAAAGSGVVRTLIYRGLSTTNLSLLDSTTDAAATSYVSSNLNNGTTYYFTVRSRGLDGSLSVTPDTVSATPNYLGPVWWVATNGNDATGDGSSTYPLATIQQAINKAAAGDTVRLKPGTYTGYGNYEIDFQGKNLVVMGDGGPDSVTIDLQASSSNPRRAFHLANFAYSSAAKIQGLRIINGFAPGPEYMGGAVLLENAGSVRIENCVIGPGNRAARGAGIAIINSNTVISGTVIKGNSAPMSSGYFGDAQGQGVGLFAQTYQTGNIVTLENCLIHSNQGVASGTTNDMFGAGLFFDGQGTSAEFRVINCLLADNSLNRDGGSGWWAYGGAATVYNGAQVVFINCTITENRVANSQSAVDGRGGALFVDGNNSSVYFLNSILWENQATAAGEAMFALQNGPNVQVNYSDLQDNFSGFGNLFVDPQFSDPANNDFTLSAASALIGAGIVNGTTYPGQDLVPSVDLAGNTRPDPTGSNPDLGAYESSLATTPYPSAPTGLAATAGDGQVSLTWDQHPNPDGDLARFGIYWGTGSGPTVKQAEVTGATATSYTVTGLNNNVTYYFRITAIDNDGYESDFSNEVSATPQYSGTDVYVDADSAGAGYVPDGSPGKPFFTIQEAIDNTNVVDGMRILVRPGTYTSTVDPVVDFKGKNIILESTDGPAVTIISGGGQRRALALTNPGFYPSGYSNTTKIIGFTFTNGAADMPLVEILGPDRSFGGTTPWEPLFRNCRFRDSDITTTNPGTPPVIEIASAAPTFLGCEFRNLRVEPGIGFNDPYAGLRGPIAVSGDNTSYSNPRFKQCVIAGNFLGLAAGAQNPQVRFQGGAVYVGNGSTPYFEDTRIDSNTIDSRQASTDQYTISTAMGGGVFIEPNYLNADEIRFVNCSISYNTVRGQEVFGGGAYIQYPQIRFVNTLVVGNTVQAAYESGGTYGSALGGGIDFNIQNWGTSDGSSTNPRIDIINCTVADNQVIPFTSTSGGGGGLARENEDVNRLYMFNSIVTGNTVSGGIDATVYNLSQWTGPWGLINTNIDYTLIEDAMTAQLTGAGDFIYTFDPHFVGNGDYSLSDRSKAIGAGTVAFAGEPAPAFDYNNDPRPNPTGSNPDLGAFENSLSSSPYPDAPANLTVADERDSTVVLVWQASAESDVVKYRIYYGTASPAATLLDSVSGVATATLTGLDNYTTYYFRVTAVDLDGFESDYSNEVSATPKYVGPVWYVDDAAAYGGDGSPATPFRTIQEGLVDNGGLSPGDTVLLLPGVYSGFGNRQLSAPSFPFVLMGRDGPDTTIIELQPSTIGYRFLTFDQVADTSTKIVNLTIQNGNANGNDGDGGAIVINGTSPMFINCRFLNNAVEQDAYGNPLRGGAVFIQNGSPAFVRTLFSGNEADEYGGAVYVDGPQSAPVFQECVFIGNSTTGSNDGRGGAIFSQSADLTINRCRFLDNSTLNWGGGLDVEDYDGQGGRTLIRSTLFAGNETRFSDGTNSRGAAFNISGVNITQLLEHLTITDNWSTGNGPAVVLNSGFMVNSIVWDNSATGDGKQIIADNGLIEIRYSLVEDGDLIPGFDGNTGLTIDPRFTNPDSGDYTLSLASFALGAGAAEYVDPFTGTIYTVDGLDLAGNARIQPAGSAPDMGAFESGYSASPYPDAPYDLTATPLHRAAELNWHFPEAPDVVKYFVYQSQDGTTWTAVDTVVGRFVNRTIIPGLTNNQLYFYQVSAVDTAGYESLPSDSVGVKPRYRGPVWYVDINATGPLYEGSPDDPSLDIRSVIWPSSDGDTILVRPGTYTGDNNRELNFQQTDQFGGMTDTPRNLVLMGEKGADSTIIDLSGFGFTSRRFLDVTSGEGPGTKLIGLTIINGEMGSNEALITVSGSQLTIEDCVFRNNVKTSNVGPIVISGDNSSLITIDRTLFSDNESTGEAVGVIYAVNLDVRNSIFYNNTARGAAAIYWNVPPGSKMVIVNCAFLYNNTTDFGSTIYIQDLTTYSIYNSIFWGNTSPGNPDVDYIRSGVHYCSVQNLAGFPTDNYSFDPRINDPENGDFSLSDFSPAIGIGTTQYFDYLTGGYEDIPATDYYGNPRPQPEGSLPDLGPIENEREVQRYFVYHVAVTGDDNTGDGLTTPFRTIARALQEAAEFDTVEVGPGTYSGPGNRGLDFGGLPLVLRSVDGPGATIIDCENQGRAFEFTSGEGGETQVIGFTVRNGNVGDDGGAVYLENSSPQFWNMIFEFNQAPSGSGGAVFATNSFAQFANCVFRGNYAQSAGAVYIMGGDVGFNFCTLVENDALTSGAVAVEDGYSLIENSILWYNSTVYPEIVTFGTGAAEVRYSNVMGGYDGPGNTNGRPGFIDGPAGNYHLEPWSPVIGRADTLKLVDFDIEGNARTVSDTTWPDLGAYEHTLAAPDTSGFIPQTWYVSPTGADSTGDGSETNPFGTIQLAVDLAIWSETVQLLPGVYDQSFDTWGKDITVRGGLDPSAVVIQGTAVLRGGAPKISRMSFRGGDQAVFVDGAQARLRRLGISGVNGVNGTILISHGDVSLRHITFADNTGRALQALDSSTVSAENTIFWNTGDHWTTDGSSTVTATYCRTDSSGTGNVAVFPRFRGSNDYHLLASSLLINAGNPADTDADGSRADIGAYPYLNNYPGPTFFVAVGGNDTTGTGSPGDPFATIQAGINFAGDLDTVRVAAGVYHERVRFREADIALIGSGGESVIDPQGSGTGLLIVGPRTSASLVEGFTFTGGYADQMGAGLFIEGGDPTIRGNRFFNNTDAVKGAGLGINQGSPLIAYNLFVNNNGHAVYVDGGSQPVFVNNTIADNSGAGIVSDPANPALAVRNTILWNNAGGSLTGAFAVTYSDVQGGVTGTGNLDLDPLFVDPAGGDYHLDLLSPCIDAGDPNDPYDADSTVVDMGAFPNIRSFFGGTSTGNLNVPADTVVIVNEDLIIDVGDTLVLEPGATLFFEDSVQLIINGWLDASGTVLAPVFFTTLDPTEIFGGIILNAGSGARDVPAYSYVTISNVGADFIPLTVNGSAILQHFTVAGNGNDTSLVVNNGTVNLDYSILEGLTAGAVVLNNSFVQSTDQFVDYAGADFHLIPEAAAIDVGVTDTVFIDPDFTYSDGGAFYHDQSGYPADSVVVLYPASGDTIPVSPDTSFTLGLETTVQVFNQYGRARTNAVVLWNEGNGGGQFPLDQTDYTDLEGRVSNRYYTNTTAGDLNSFVVSSDGVTAGSGLFLIEPGVPDSVWILEQDTLYMTQLDTLTLQAEVFDQFGNYVRDGEAVTWSVIPLVGSGDGFYFDDNTTFTVNGVATIVLMTDPNTSLSVGDEIQVEAVSGGGSHISAVIRIIPDDIYNLSMPDELTADTLRISADVAMMEISATLIDTFGNPLENVEINWEITAGSSSGGSLSAASSFTDATGTAAVTLTTSTNAGDRFQVRGWVTAGALIAALSGDNSAVPQPMTAGRTPVRELPTATLKARVVRTSRRSAHVAFVGAGPSREVIGARTDGVDRTAIYDLDDTTAVILVLPGVTTTVELPQDSMDVLQGQEVAVTLDAFDQFGNRVADGTPVTWAIVPAGPNVSIVESADSTVNGKASVQFRVADDAEWEFDFRIQGEVEGVVAQSGPFNVDDITPPAAVSGLSISPDVWTATNAFTLTWTNPPEHSGVAGVYYQIDDNPEVYVAGQDTSTIVVSLPANAAATVKVWLQDNAGNQDPNTAQAVVARWDDTPPEAFDLLAPLAGWYGEAYLSFQWQAANDVTAGLERYELIIDGTQRYTLHPDSTRFDVPDAFSEGSHTWTVEAYDSSGNETEATNPQTIQIDFTAPTITHNPVLEATDNTPVTITASFTDAQSGIAVAELYFRKGGESAWQPAVDMTTLPSYQIASSFVNSGGVEYYLRAVDVAGNTTYKPAEGAFYSISVTIPTPGLVSTDKWPGGIPNGTEVANYQLISFPATPAKDTPTDVLVDDLGEYDNTVWRFFQYGGGNTWVEFANIPTIESGKAYFIIVKDPGMNINTGQAYTVKTDAPFQINLPAGDWTFIGNPFDFDIPLENVLLNDTVSVAGDINFYTYDGDWVPAAKLERWRGYIYKTADGGTLSILPRKSAGGQLARRMDDERPLNEKEWRVRISATNGWLRDTRNEVGVLATAADTYDRRDAFEPPLLPGGVSLRIDNRDWAEHGDIYTADYRSIHEDGHYWDLEVIAPDVNYNAYVGFEGIEDIPEEFDVWAVDLTIGMAQDLRWKPRYRYAVVDPDSPHRIRFLVGTREFVQANSGGVELYPDRYSLSQNYPNPFNPQTSILITLAEAAYVDLVVFNLLGQEIYRLADHEYRPAGYHNFIWKGKNQNGQRVASGVYFYIARITGPDGKVILNRTRKMVLVK